IHVAFGSSGLTADEPLSDTRKTPRFGVEYAPGCTVPICGESYVSAYPARMLVLPSPVTSHARPARGPRLFFCDLYSWSSPLVPTCTSPVVGEKLDARLF